MSKVVLIIIYNHRFDRNIEVLEQVYRDRFTDIVHLMPFYTGDRPNVVPVYANSYHFQGYVAQGLRSYFREGVAHYLFVADDLILNPAINETNYAEHFGLSPGTCYLPRITLYHNIKNGFWQRVIEAYQWRMHAPGLQVWDQLPDYADALERFRRHHLDLRPMSFGQIWQTPGSVRDWLKTLARDPGFLWRLASSRITHKKYFLSYPLVGGYADAFAVGAETIRPFCHFCGVFAAAGLFVEHAIPTAMVLAAGQLQTESALPWKGRVLWTEAQRQELDRYSQSLRQLLDDFPAGCLYLHPVKLSQWNTDL